MDVIRLKTSNDTPQKLGINLNNNFSSIDFLIFKKIFCVHIYWKFTITSWLYWLWWSLVRCVLVYCWITTAPHQRSPRCTRNIVTSEPNTNMISWARDNHLNTRHSQHTHASICFLDNNQTCQDSNIFCHGIFSFNVINTARGYLC